MNDTQILTLALSVIVPVSMLIYSNSRISDTRDTLKNSIAETKETLRAETATLRAETAMGFERVMGAIKELEAKLATHELEHHRK